MKYQEIPDYQWGGISDQRWVENAKKFCEATGFDKNFDLVDGAWHLEFHWKEGIVDFEMRFSEDAVYQFTAYLPGDITMEVDGMPITCPIPESLYDAVFDIVAQKGWS